MKKMPDHALPATPLSPSASSGAKASLTVSGKGTGGDFLLSGEWTVHTLQQVEPALRAAVRHAEGACSFDFKGISRIDTAGALVLNEARAALKGRGLQTTLQNATDRHKELLEKSVLPPPDAAEKQGRKGFSPLRSIASIGKTVCEDLWMAGQLIGFLGHFLVSASGQLLRPSRMRWTSLIFHMEQTGLRAVPIVALLTFLIGMVVAYMGSEELAKFGAQVFAVNLLEVTIMREMGVLITAIVVAGRSSSSFTAQIGAMVANEEVAALRSMGLDPMALLVVPRVLGLILTLPMLVFLADMAALLGGATAVWYSMDLSFSAFVGQFYNVAQLKNFMVGIVKTPFFALVIGVVGCFQGFRATTSAESVGFLTTIAVVEAIFIVIVLDALFAIFFTTIGI